MQPTKKEGKQEQQHTERKKGAVLVQIIQAEKEEKSFGLNLAKKDQTPLSPSGRNSLTRVIGRSTQGAGKAGCRDRGCRGQHSPWSGIPEPIQPD